MSKDLEQEFAAEVRANINGLSSDSDLKGLSNVWVREAGRYKWAYNFRWLGRPAIQFPNDAWALQELIWSVKPDLVIETGIAHGGSLIYSASLLALLDMCDAIEADAPMNLKQPNRKVLGIDIDIRDHNRRAIEAHPMAGRIQMIEGSSIDAATVDQVKRVADGASRVLVCLDSNHTHDHVLAELEHYAPLVSVGSYCIVFDTLVEDMPADLSVDRPWGPGDNPKTAVWEFLKNHQEFAIDADIPNKLQISVAPDGYLRRLS